MEAKSMLTVSGYWNTDTWFFQWSHSPIRPRSDDFKLTIESPNHLLHSTLTIGPDDKIEYGFIVAVIGRLGRQGQVWIVGC